MIQQQAHWIPYELKARDVDRQLFTREQLLQQQKMKSFLQRIIKSYDNPKCRRSWGKPDHALTSSTKPHIYG